MKFQCGGSRASRTANYRELNVQAEEGAEFWVEGVGFSVEGFGRSYLEFNVRKPLSVWGFERVQGAGGVGCRASGFGGSFQCAGSRALP